MCYCMTLPMGAASRNGFVCLSIEFGPMGHKNGMEAYRNVRFGYSSPALVINSPVFGQKCHGHVDPPIFLISCALLLTKVCSSDCSRILTIPFHNVTWIFPFSCDADPYLYHDKGQHHNWMVCCLYYITLFKFFCKNLLTTSWVISKICQIVPILRW